MTTMQKLLWFLGMLVACNPETPSDERVHALKPPKLVAQRVTATVKRGAAWLVHIRTEHEALVTTPEHPFATPRSGWIPAGRLVPRDRVVSARFGTVRVLSVQHEKPAQPPLVFNLSVDPSHAYVVGTDQVLVHNRKCIDPAETAKELEEAERKLEELEVKLLLSLPEEKATLAPKIAEVKSQVAKLKQRLRKALTYQKKKASTETEPSGPEPGTAPDPEAPRKDAFGRTARAIEALDAEIRALETTAGSTRRLAELKRERGRLKRNLRTLRVIDKRKHGVAVEPQDERLLKGAEADYASRRLELEAAQRELSELSGENVQSDAEKKSQAERRAALEEKLEILQLEHDASKEILAGQRQIAELSERTPSTDAEREQIAAELRGLRAMLEQKRRDRRNRESFRKWRADPAAWEKRLRDANEARRKRLRTDDYVADPERARDTLELLKEELEERRREAGAESREDRTEYLMERIETLEARVELSRERERIRSALNNARRRRRERIGAGQDAPEIEQKIAQLEQELSVRKTRYVQLSLREKVLAKLDGTTRTDGLNEVDEARLRELERELERERYLTGGAASGHPARARRVRADRRRVLGRDLA